MIEELYNKIDKFCNETDWSKYPTYEHALEEFIKGVVAEENTELKEQISTKDILIKELQEQKAYWKESSFDWRHKFFKKGSTKRLVQKDKQLTKAKELLQLFICTDGIEDFIEVRDKAEQFLSEVKK